MATGNTAKTEATKDERKTIVNALMMLHTSLARGAKAAKSEAIAEATQLEATKVHALANRIATGELSL